MASGDQYAPMPALIPPFRHALVEEGLHRGAHPSLKNMRFMRRLRLRTILSLIPEASGPARDLIEYCEAEGVRLIWHKVDKYNDGFAHTPRLVADVLSNLIDARKLPLFLHCRDGSHNTGLVVMCLRRLQNWSLPTIYDEFTRYTKGNEISFKEQQFVESFHAKVTIPLETPRWLWQGVRHEKHPSIPLEFERDPAAKEANEEPGADRISNGLREQRNRELAMLKQAPPAAIPSQRKRFLTEEQKVKRKEAYVQYSLSLAGLDLDGVKLDRPRRTDRRAANQR